jgi:hypothetical protein
MANIFAMGRFFAIAAATHLTSALCSAALRGTARAPVQ